MSRKCLALSLAFLFLAAGASGQQRRVVFSGTPVVRVSTDAEGANRQQLPTADATKYAAMIVEQGGRYFWATREMKELVKSESGAFVTYHAVDGSGYLRVTLGDPALYVEHLLLALSSVTYYGQQQ